MKKLLFLFLLIITALYGSSQTYTAVHNYQAPDGVNVIKSLGIPYGQDTTFALAPDSVYVSGVGGGYKKLMSLFYQQVDSTLYLHRNGKWVPVGSGTGSGSSTKITYLKYPLYAYNDSTIAEYHDDGLVTPASVTHLHDSTFYVNSGLVYWINGIQYTTGGDTVVLSGIDPDLPVKFLFIVDTTGHASFLRGTPATIPLDTVATPGVSLALTSGITFQAGATEPDNIVTETIYNETAVSPEWAISHVGYMVMDSLNTDNPYSGTHDIFISKYAPLGGVNPVITFQKASVDTFHGDDVIQFALYLNGKLGNTRLYFDLLKSGSYATQYIFLENGYVNKNDSNRYVLVTIPFNTLTWLNNGTFDAVRLGFLGVDTSGAKGLYLDKIILQHGVNSIRPATDFSYKEDSVHMTTTAEGTDTLYNFKGYAKGVPINNIGTIRTHAAPTGGTWGSITGTLSDQTDLQSALDSKVNVADTAAMLSPYPNRQELSDSAAAIRADFPAAGTGTVTSVAKGYGLVADGIITTTGTITVDSATLSLKYVRAADTAQMLSNYQPKLNSGVGSNILISGNNISASDSTAYSSIAAAPYTFDSSYTVLKRRNSVNDSLVSPIPIDSLRRTAGSTQVEARKGGTWVNAFTDSTGSSSPSWLLAGNPTLVAGNFLGSTTYVPLEFRVRNIRSGYIDSANTTAGQTLLGYGAGLVNTSLTSTFIGFFSGKANTSGASNTALGSQALKANITGGNNTAIGEQAMLSGTGGSNTAVGSSAFKTGSGGSNTAIGYQAMTSIGSASSGVAIGANAMALYSGSNSVGIGLNALQSGTGGENVAIGNDALFNNGNSVTGGFNTAAGSRSGGYVTSGTNNTFLGYLSGVNSTTQSNQLFVNSVARSASYNSSQAESIIYGQQNTNLLSQYLALNAKVGINNIAPTSFLQLHFGLGVAGTSPLKFSLPPNLTTTAATGTGTSATLSFAVQTSPPFIVGSSITISGVTPSGYNGTYQVQGCTDSTVLFLNTTTAAQTVAGTITQGGLLTTLETGAVENDSTNIYFTGGTGTNLFRNKLLKGITGTATLASGTVTVSTAYIKAGSTIQLTYNTISGTPGFLSAPSSSFTAGTSFVINSSSASDNSTVYWTILNPQ